MPNQFRCVHCGGEFIAAEQHGREAICPHCGAEVATPRCSDLPAINTGKPSRLAARAKRGRFQDKDIAAIVAVVAFCVILLLSFAVFSWTPSSGTPNASPPRSSRLPVSAESSLRRWTAEHIRQQSVSGDVQVGWLSDIRYNASSKNAVVRGTFTERGQGYKYTAYWHLNQRDEWELASLAVGMSE